jgi:hypothetical protein
MKLKKLTNESWFLYTNDLEKIGILSKQKDSYFILASAINEKFNSWNEILNFFNISEFTFIEDEKHSDSLFDIDGYPTDIEFPIIKDLHSELKLIQYAKTDNSEIYYSPGYFCLHFPKQAMPAFCPKITTIQKYNFSGPFKSKEEMNIELTNLRRKSKNS